MCTRSIALKAELRSLKLGDLSIDASFSKIESIATILTSLGLPINNDDVVTNTLERLPDKYDNVFGGSAGSDGQLGILGHSGQITGQETLFPNAFNARKYAVEIIKRAHMVNCNPSQNPVDTESKLGDDGDLVFDLTLYESLAGSIQYLTFTRS
nr:ribonuclease H-like domain-containing protein [Tanacetum cinerariifolium]